MADTLYGCKSRRSITKSSKFDYIKSNLTKPIIHKRVGFDGEVQTTKYSKGLLLGKGGFAKCYKFTNIETLEVYLFFSLPFP